MTTLSIDLETYSEVDLKSCGVYKYAAHPSFEILLIAYAIDDGPVEAIDLPNGNVFATGAEMTRLKRMLRDPEVTKRAYNANFERTCLAKHFGQPALPEQWVCTMVQSASIGLAHSMDTVATALKLPWDLRKATIGKNLIRYFSIPCKPTAANGNRTRNMPKHDPEKWAQFVEYCRQDVVTERAIADRLAAYPLLEKERRLWALDQRINDLGVRVDPVLVKRALECDRLYRDKLTDEAVEITGLANPASVQQLRNWLADEGIETEALTKETVVEILKQDNTAEVARMMTIRQELSKTSVKKYLAMDKAIGRGDRIRGLLQFNGANRTGRWAGRLVQVQNLPQNHLHDLDTARDLLRAGEYDTLDLLYESTSNVLSQLIRTAFIPADGCRFIVADFSAIEARVIAWLAEEQWRLDVFSSHGKIYEASAAQMFKVPIESVTKGSPLRQKGKISELALGYQGGVGALAKMGALKMGLQEDELQGLVDAWRKANPNIVKLWYTVEEAALEAVLHHSTIEFKRGLKFIGSDPDVFFIQLPSGRKIAYLYPQIKSDPKFQKQQLTYAGVEQETKRFERSHTYGGKLVENIIQSIARDCLADAMLRLDEAGYRIVMHVHDEVVLETPVGQGSVEEACGIMGVSLPWAPGLPLRADGFQTPYYKKD